MVQVNMFKSYLLSNPMLACFDGDEGDGEGSFEATEAAAVQAQRDAEDKAQKARDAVEAARKAREAQFSQEELNKFLADDRRKHLEKYTKLEDSYKKILADKNLASEQRVKLETELQDLQKSFRTKEQQAEYERKQQKERYEQELNEARQSATQWENMFKSSVVDRSLLDAATTNEAFNPHQIVEILRPRTKMADHTDKDGNATGQLVPMIDFPDIDEKSGEKIITLRTPEEAVQRMKELPNFYGNLFRANVVSGVGSGAATGGALPGTGGRIDPAKLAADPELYRRLRKENPEALGLRRDRT